MKTGTEFTKLENEKLRALLSIASTLNSNLEIDHLLPYIMISARDLLEAEASSLFLLDQKHNNLYCEVAIGEKGKILKKYLKLELGEGIAGWVAKEGLGVLIEDAYKDSRFDSTWDQKTGFVTKSVICLPLYSKNKFIGTLEVINKTNGLVFEEFDRQLLDYMGNLAAVALDNARLHESLQVKIRELSFLTDLEQKIAAGWDTNRLIPWVLQETMEVVEAKGGTVLLYDHSRNLIINNAAGFMSEQVKIGEPVPTNKGIVNLSTSENRPILVKNIHADARFQGQPVLSYESSSMICAPIQWQDEVFGFFVVNEKNDGFLFSRDDVASVQSIGERISMVLKTAGLFKQLKKSTQEEKSARQLMEKILPQSTPSHSRLKIETRYIPYRHIGGDFYRFLELGPNKYGILAVDVSGHGLSAALISVMVNTMLSAISHEDLFSPAAFFTSLNAALQGRMGGNFLTAFYTIIDITAGKILYANAGHTEGIFYSKAGDSFNRLNAKGPLLGVWSDPVFEEVEMDIAEGDRMFIYTDGLLELMGEKEMMLIDENELQEIVRKNLSDSGKIIANKIIEKILEASNCTEFNDDVTLIVVDMK